ncbi:EamA family transporter [Bacterioplanes sanyensis]|uniref:EamA family transporter n=1 Tax=Bacterioplanes sanyensis TaxID=1249553 RepID=A0A222FLR3_9GAMM|nr:DMT family transporter [Bacterioplanes sanyensis]ASP39948.1 EamA family transporter [Bacterioplanes sanyensis]
MHSERRALMLALAAVLLWSTVATAFKLALAELSPRWLLAVASLASLAFLSGYLLYTSQLKTALQNLRETPWFYLRQGLINPLLYYLILFQAYDLLPAQQAQSINYTWALTMSLLAVPLLGQALYARDMVALTLAYLGVVVIATKGDPLALQFDSPLGVALALLSTLLWALYWIWNTAGKHAPHVSLWCGFALATPLIWLVAWFWDGWPGATLLSQAGAAAVYVGLFEMGVTFLLWQTAMSSTQRTAAISSLIFLSPFLSLIFISQILGEPIHPATFIGLVLIISGLVIQKMPKRGSGSQAASS